MKKPFLEAVEAGPLVFDGGVGTQLYERGVYTNRSFDDANLSRADLVRQIHEDYLLSLYRLWFFFQRTHTNQGILVILPILLQS